MAHHIADLHAVFLDCELERPFVIGHSLGGQVVAQWAGIFAELPRAIVLIEGLGPPYALNRFPEDVKQKRARTAIEALTHPRQHSAGRLEGTRLGPPEAGASPPRPGARARVRRPGDAASARRRPGVEVGSPGGDDLDVERTGSLRRTLELGDLPPPSSSPPPWPTSSGPAAAGSTTSTPPPNPKRSPAASPSFAEASTRRSKAPATWSTTTLRTGS